MYKRFSALIRNQWYQWIHRSPIRPVQFAYKYEYEYIFVLVALNWCGKFEFFYYKYRNVFVASFFSPRTDVVFVFSEYKYEHEFVFVFSWYRTNDFYEYEYKYRYRIFLLRRNGITRIFLFSVHDFLIWGQLKFVFVIVFSIGATRRIQIQLLICICRNKWLVRFCTIRVQKCFCTRICMQIGLA